MENKTEESNPNPLFRQATNLPEGYVAPGLGGEFIKPDDMPVGGLLEGLVEDISGNFTTDANLDDACNLVLREKNTRRLIIFPINGTMNQDALRIKGGLPSLIGKMVAIARGPDGHSKKFDKKMFNLRLAVAGAEVVPIPSVKNGGLKISSSGEVALLPPPK